MLFDTIRIHTDHYGKVLAYRTDYHLNTEIASKVVKSDYVQELSFEDWRKHVSNSLQILPTIIKNSSHLLETLQEKISLYRSNSTEVVKICNENLIRPDNAENALDSFLNTFLWTNIHR